MQRSSRVLAGLSGFFWGVALALVVLFVFLATMGAFDPLEVIGVTLAVAGLAALCVVHAMLARRHADRRRGDLMQHRERRGF